MTDKEFNKYCKEVWDKFTRLTDERAVDKVKQIKKSVTKKLNKPV